MFDRKPINKSKVVDCRSSDSVKAMLADLRQKRFAVPAEFRFNLFKTFLKENPANAEKITSNIVRMMFDYDKEYLIRCVQGWKEKKEEAAVALKNIDLFFADIKLPDEMSFQQHAYYCFCLSALISGIAPEEVEAAYDEQLHVMVNGTIHPSGKWSVKEEFENQYYTKFIVHVSKTGLASVSLFNEMTAVSVDDKPEDKDDDKDENTYWSVHLVAAACGEDVGFDGIKNCKSREVLNHDLIHSGFKKYAVMHDKERYWSCLRKLGIMEERIQADTELQKNPLLLAQVKAAKFMWTHEYTTSSRVHGFPRRLPRKYGILGDIYASSPQVALRWTAKFNLIQPVFSNEIENEAKLLDSMGIEMDGLKEDSTMTPHERVKEINHKLHPGYEYLVNNFSALYGHQHWFSAWIRRACHNGENCTTDMIKHTFGY